MKALGRRKVGSGLFLTAVGFWGLAATGNSIVLPWRANLRFRYLGAAYFSKWDSEDAGFAPGLWGLGNLGFAQSERSRAGCFSIGSLTLPVDLQAWGHRREAFTEGRRVHRNCFSIKARKRRGRGGKPRRALLSSWTHITHNLFPENPHTLQW